MESIHFFKEDIRFRLNHAGLLKKWIHSVFRFYRISPGHINYVFCSDPFLRKLNKDFLKHDYYTDILTFNVSDDQKKPEADIFISIDRVRADSKKFSTTFTDELHRVIVHGALHLSGLNDRNSREQKKMKAAEDYWLSKRRF